MRASMLIFVLLMAILPISCGSSTSRRPVFPTSGKILLNGKPAENALVVFHPMNASDGEAKPRGKVGPDGTYKLTTYDTDDGAPAGEYRVTVELWLAGRGDEAPSNRLRPNLAKPESSGLMASVSSGANEIKTIELKR